MISDFIVIVPAFLGLLVSIEIFLKKYSQNKPLVCPLHMQCEQVVKSKYGKFMGIPVEVFGVLYYGFIFGLYLLDFAGLVILSDAMHFILLAVTTTALLFSIYLTVIQIFTLKQYCSWCLFSAFMTLIIFVAAWIYVPFDFVPFLQDRRMVLLGLHLLGMALGLGGATITDLMFFKFLKDLRISHKESEVLESLSEVIWIGLMILILSGLGLFFGDSAKYLASDKFLAKVVVVIVIILNGAILNLVVSPKLMSISWGEEHKHKSGELRYLRKMSFALGAISITSWYTAFILGMFRQSPVSLEVILLIYFAVLLTAITISQFIERSFSNIWKMINK